MRKIQGFAITVRWRGKCKKMAVAEDIPGTFRGHFNSFPSGNEGDLGLIPGLERYPGEENGYTLQNSCLENSMDREAWWPMVHRVAEPDMTEQLTLPFFNNLQLIQILQPKCKPFVLLH